MLYHTPLVSTLHYNRLCVRFDRKTIDAYPLSKLVTNHGLAYVLFV